MKRKDLRTKMRSKLKNVWESSKMHRKTFKSSCKLNYLKKNNESLSLQLLRWNERRLPSNDVLKSKKHLPSGKKNENNKTARRKIS